MTLYDLLTQKPHPIVGARLIVRDTCTDTPMRKHPERIRLALKDGPKMSREVRKLTGIEAKSLEATLRRMRRAGEVTYTARKWALK